MFCKCQEIRSLWQKLPRVLKDTIRQKLHSGSDVCILTDVSKLKGIPREQCNWISLSLLIVKRVILRHWMVHLCRNLFQTRQKQHLCKEFPRDWEAGWTITEKTSEAVFMILGNTEFLQRPEILVRNELRRKVRHEYFFKNLLNNHWQVVEIREDFLKLCFSKGQGVFLH